MRIKALSSVLLATGISVLGISASTAAVHPSAAAPPYTGSDTHQPSGYPAPKSCQTVGFQAPTEAPEISQIEIAAFKKQVAALHGKSIVLNDALSETQQVTNFQQLLSDKVGALEVYPLDPTALTTVFKNAVKQNVSVFPTDMTFGPPTASTPPYASQLGQQRDYSAYVQAKWIWQHNPHAYVAVIGLSIPVPGLEYEAQREAYWVKKFGLNYLGEQTQSTDDETGGQGAMNALLTRYPKLNASLSYSDRVETGAAAAAKAAGRKVLTIGINGDSEAFASIKAGALGATVMPNAVNSGIQLANGECTRSINPKATIPKLIETQVILVDSSNVNTQPELSQILAKTKF